MSRNVVVTGALGLVNITSDLFQGFPVSGSSSRTPVAESGVQWVDWEDRESGTTDEGKP